VDKGITTLGEGNAEYGTDRLLYRVSDRGKAAKVESLAKLSEH
jgi:hypothetical protein